MNLYDHAVSFEYVVIFLYIDSIETIGMNSIDHDNVIFELFIR